MKKTTKKTVKKAPKTPPKPASRYPRSDGSNVAGMPGVDIEKVKAGPTDAQRAAALMPEITAAQQDIWERLAPLAVANETLDDLSIDLFVSYCDVTAQLRELEAFRDDMGYTFKNNGRAGEQAKIHPEIGQLNILRQEQRALGVHFGISAYHRKNLGQLGKKAVKPANPFK